MAEISVDAYKNTWLYSEKTGNYECFQKEEYPFAWFDSRLFRRLPILRDVCRLLGRNLQGVDSYRFYEQVIEDGNREVWQNEFFEVRKELEELGHSLRNQSILDVSGEPGFFARDATEVCSGVDVTAFAENVSVAMAQVLGLKSQTFDFNTESLEKKYSSRLFDWIFVRYGIAYCENLGKFVSEASTILKTGGHICLLYSPASRAIAARSMFDDYAYLRLWSLDFLKETFVSQGFEVSALVNLNSFRWDSGKNILWRLLSMPYRRRIFRGVQTEEYLQRNILVVFRKAGQ